MLSHDQQIPSFLFRPHLSTFFTLFNAFFFTLKLFFMYSLIPYLLDGVALVEVKPALHANTRLSFESPKDQTTRVTMH